MAIGNQSSEVKLAYRILFTIAMLIIYRVGSYIPTPGIDAIVLEEVAQRNKSGILGMFNMLSGGSLGRMSIFALAIMPYITASIIVQLLSISYKPLENLKKQGEQGRYKINQISRYLTVPLAAMQSYGLSAALIASSSGKNPIIVIDPTIFKVVTVLTFTVGTMLLMWLAEQINVKGIGNGSSIIIFTGIISGIPSAVINMFELSRKGVISPVLLFATLLAIALVIIVVIFFEKAQRRVLIQYPKRQIGNRVYGGDSNYLPLKLNTAGVIPPIFASAILLFPSTISNFSGPDGSGVLSSIAYYLGRGKPLYTVLNILMISFFCFFYTSIVFNSEETANNLRKNGAYVPGQRPGPDTAKYFDNILSRITVIGAIYLCVVCVLPEVMMSKYTVAISLTGTSFLIVVSVVLDTFTQIQTHLFTGRYESMMKKMKL